MNNKLNEKIGLKKVLGLPLLFIISIGLVVSLTSVVSILQGAGIGGGSFFISIFFAFILTLCYISTYSELALMLPKAGSISTYTAVSVGHFPAIIAAIAAYLAPAIFTLPAELLLLQHVFDTMLPGSFSYIALTLLWVFVLLNLLGIDLFASIQSVITYTMLVTILVIALTGLTTSGGAGTSNLQLFNQLINPDGAAVFSLILIALWPFISFELICDLIEEAKNPNKHLPKAMFLASTTMLICYSLIAYAAIIHVPAVQLAKSEVPHLLLGEALFGKAGKIIILILAITTTSGIINAAMAAVPRMLYGMAHHKQLPAIFMKVHPKWNTPWVSIIFLAALITIPIFVFSNNPDALLILLISASTCWLIAYIIAHIDLIVLRKKYKTFPRPFKTPLYPLPQIIGIIGMIYAIINNAPTPELRLKVYLNTVVFIGITAIFAFFWVKYKMKKGLLEPEAIEQALID